MANFAAVKAAISLERAAKLLNLAVKPSGSQLRGPCPACENDDERILALTPSKGVFFCHSAEIGGSVIDLAAHILGLSLKDAADWLNDTLPREATVPQKPEARTAKAQPAPKEFDPEAFANKLAYSQEVEQLGLSEEDATRLCIGFHASYKRVYFPVRNIDGSIAGFVGLLDHKAVKLPPRWLMSSNVVRLKRA